MVWLFSSVECSVSVFRSYIAFSFLWEVYFSFSVQNIFYTTLLSLLFRIFFFSGCVMWCFVCVCMCVCVCECVHACMNVCTRVHFLSLNDVDRAVNADLKEETPNKHICTTS